MKNCLFFGLSLTLLMLTGCGNNVRLGGKVTFTDGTPLGIGIVCFEKESEPYLARATIKTDGTYVVGSLSENDGLPAGKYRVYFTNVIKEIGQEKVGQDTFTGTTITMPIYESLIDEKYNRASTSGLNVEVPVAGGKFDIQVEPYVPTKKKK
jgi:hypothetical protein